MRLIVRYAQPRCGPLPTATTSLPPDRLAQGYDAAMDRDEVAKSGQRNDLVVGHNEVKPTAADLGIRRDEIHEARKMGDVERDDA